MKQYWFLLTINSLIWLCSIRMSWGYRGAFDRINIGFSACMAIGPWFIF